MSIENTDQTWPLRRPKSWWEMNIKMNVCGVKNWIIWQFIFLFHNCDVYFGHNRLCTLFSLPTFLTIIYEHLRFRLIQ